MEAAQCGRARRPVADNGLTVCSLVVLLPPHAERGECVHKLVDGSRVRYPTRDWCAWSFIHIFWLIRKPAGRGGLGADTRDPRDDARREKHRVRPEASRVRPWVRQSTAGRKSKIATTPQVTETRDRLLHLRLGRLARGSSLGQLGSPCRRRALCTRRVTAEALQSGIAGGCLGLHALRLPLPREGIAAPLCTN